MRALPLILIAATVSTVVVLIWYHFRHQFYLFFGIDIANNDGEELGSDLVVFVPGIIYGALEGFILNRIMGQNARILSSIDTLNAITFLEERDRRTHFLIHLSMFFIFLFTVFTTSLFDYSTVRIAQFVIGGCTFLYTFTFIIAIELDSPFFGPWKVNGVTIPDGWMTMNIHDILHGRVPHYQNPSSCKDPMSETQPSNTDVGEI